MVFTKALALKVLGGTLFLGSASTGIYFINDHLKNQLTIYDQALIDHLGVKGADIKFAIVNGSTALTTFPTTFSENPQTATVTVKVKVAGTNENTEGTITPGTDATGNTLGTVDYLKNLNKVSNTATEWTWTCEIKLTKETGSESVNTLNTKQKEKMFKDSDGFLNKLKAASGTDATIKQLKQDFIRNCAYERGKAKNKEVNGLENLSTVDPAHTLKSTKGFNLRKGDSTKDAWGGGEKEVATNLYFSNAWEFENWFKAKPSAQ